MCHETIDYKYTVSGSAIDKVKRSNDLGVLLTSVLTLSPSVALKSLGFIIRTLKELSCLDI